MVALDDEPPPDESHEESVVSSSSSVPEEQVLPAIGGGQPAVTDSSLPVAGDDQPSTTSNQQLTTDDFRSGFVALVGKPNVGKSTLLNALLGQKVAIVSPKPQTTRIPMRGILNRPDAQIIFVDTPGIHDPRTKLGSFMVDQARRSIPDADVVCFVVDISAPPNRIEGRIAALATRARAKRILVLNKLDQRTRDGQQHLDAYRALGPWDMEVAVSALRRKGLETLVDEIVQRLPIGAPLYPPDQLTDQSEREHAAELVREQVLRYTEQEVPHGVAVEVEEWEDKEQAAYIRMTIYVEKESQKGILIGANGAMLKRIGSAARQAIEAAVGRPVYLDLWVKARPNWRDDPSSLHWLGYRSDQ
jgi:GTP-binding protein Era